MDQAADLWKTMLTMGLLALGWFLKSLSARVTTQEQQNAKMAVVENNIISLIKKSESHDSQLGTITEKFGSIEKSLGKLQVYHEQDAENWSFVFEKLDKLADGNHGIH